MQTIYMVESKHQRTHKRQFRLLNIFPIIKYVFYRSRADPWRRYGTLQMIHQIGGWIATPGQRKNSRKIKYIKPGTQMTIPEPSKPNF